MRVPKRRGTCVAPAHDTRAALQAHDTRAALQAHGTRVAPTVHGMRGALQEHGMSNAPALRAHESPLQRTVAPPLLAPVCRD